MKSFAKSEKRNRNCQATGQKRAGGTTCDILDIILDKLTKGWLQCAHLRQFTVAAKLEEQNPSPNIILFSSYQSFWEEKNTKSPN